MKKEVDLLYKAGEGRLGTNESEFIRVLSTKSYSELYSIFAVYKEKCGHSFDEALRKELSGNFLLGKYF